MKKKKSWKMNFQKVPETILAKVKKVEGDDFAVACVKKIRQSDVEAGKYSHLGLAIRDGALVFPSEQIPNVGNGRFSHINVHGKELVLKDQPKVLKTFSVEAPNWGDSYNGTHTVDFEREVYQREWFPPKELSLHIEIVDEDSAADKTYAVLFRVNEVLSKKAARFMTSPNLTNDLFFDLNLLQENVGAVDIAPSGATRADYLKTVYVDWEILPVGEREATIAKILSRYKSPSPEIRQKVAERYDLLAKLKPENFVNGTSGFRRYFGAKFSDSLVVFENLEYGNAIYAMFEDWESLSKRSRIELLNGSRAGFERIVHTAGWQERLTGLIKKKLRPAA